AVASWSASQTRLDPARGGSAVTGRRPVFPRLPGAGTVERGRCGGRCRRRRGPHGLLRIGGYRPDGHTVSEPVLSVPERFALGLRSHASWRRLGNDGITQHADTFDFDFDHIAGLERRRLARSAGEDQVAGMQRDVAADEADGGCDVVDELPGPLFLPFLAVDAQTQEE